MSHSPQRGALGALRGFLGVPLRAQTYRNLAYLALAFPLGLGYFVAVTVGLSTGVGLAITLVGIPLLVLTLAMTVGLAGFEAKLASWLVGVEVTPPAGLDRLDESLDSVDALVDATRRLLTTPTTWTGLLLVLLKFVFGIVAFTALVTAFTLAAALLTTPLFYDVAGVTYGSGAYVVDSLGEALAAAGLGVLVVLVSLHVLNGLARLGALTTAFLLGDAGESSQAEA
jgi:hypothetical protein